MKKLILIMLSLITLTSFSQDTTKVVDLTDIEVTGVRTSSKTPISQKTLTSEDITKTYQGQEMSYILDKTTSITSQSDGGNQNGYTTFRLRGIDQTRINMTLNGVPLNEPEDQGVYFSNYPNFALNIKSMQIQRGVGTSSNGTASYGGSINFESKTGLDRGLSAEYGYGSFNTHHINTTYSSGISKNKLALFTSVSGYKSDGYKYNSSGQGYSAFVSAGYYGGKNVIKFTGFTGRSMNQMAWFAVSEADIKLDPRTNYNPIGEDDDFTQSFAQLQYVRGLTSHSTITTTAYYNRLDGVWGMFVDSVNVLKFKLGSNFYGIQSNYLLEVNNLVFNLGIHANTYNRGHNGSIGGISLYSNIGYKNEYSIYSKIGYKLGKFNIYADLQGRKVGFTYVGDTTMVPFNWFFFNPKGGITFNHSNNVNYYFSVGQNHREPTRTDLFGGNDNLISVKNLVPESVIDYELGSNVKFNKLSLQYNFYYMDFKNELTFSGGLGPNGLNLMSNVSKSYRSGVEIDLNYKLFKGFSITNSSNYSYCRIKGDGKEFQPLYTPNLIVNQGLLYTIKGFYIGASAKYSSKSYINSDNTLYTPEFIIYNATLGYTTKHYSVDLQGVNLANTQYYTSGYGIGTDRYLYVNAPLSGYITFKATF